ncbi:MAG: hypothetical protein HYS46_05545 [Betaproteobacteria bacterium]|nr:hypothetical protein [Betaproteobacteria bacterium]
MNRLLAGILMYPLSSPLFAAAMEEGAASAPSETVSLVWVIVFAVIFFGMIVGFFVYLWHTEKNRKPEE